MCAFAIAKIRGGGEVDLKAVGLSSLERHMSSSAQVEETGMIPTLTPLQRYTPPTVDVKKLTEHPAMKTMLDTLTKYFVRVGKEGLVKLDNLLQYRLLGGGAGDTAHELVDSLMEVEGVVTEDDQSISVIERRRNAYTNNVADPGNLQRRRIQNAGARAVSAVSTGRTAKRKRAVSTCTPLVPHL